MTPRVKAMIAVGALGAAVAAWWYWKKKKPAGPTWTATTVEGTPYQEADGLCFRFWDGSGEAVDLSFCRSPNNVYNADGSYTESSLPGAELLGELKTWWDDTFSGDEGQLREDA